ncbi:MAG: CSS-motif domain-containing protein, partial [Stenotrophomonas sp.]
MNRARIIAATVLFALLGAFLPIATVAYFTWARATEAEQDRLQLTAERTLLRAHRAYEAGLLALRRLNQSALEPCSADHLQLMSSLVLSTHS